MRKEHHSLAAQRGAHRQELLDQTTGKQHRQRLRRALRRASQRTLRRLRTEKHEPPTPTPTSRRKPPAGQRSKVYSWADRPRPI